MTTLETLLHDPDAAGVWNLVPDKSTIGFKIKNMWGLVPVKGRFTEFTGDGQLTATGAVSGRVDIRVASLHTGIRRRDRHLLSGDFFDAERFPEISVVVTGLEPTTGNAADLSTSFTIKGTSAEVPLPVKITEMGDGSIRVAGETTLDRFQFGVDWNKGGMIGAAATVTTEAIFVQASR
jgi:polyisoprenoid-binding protein YceI